jgi:hypothetical protein
MAEIAGLKLIVPSSVSATGTATASVTASGKITVTGMNSTNTISVNGCFSSTYDNYLIVYRSTAGGAGGLAFRLRVSGSDASGSNYTSQRIDANNTTVSGSRATSQTYADFGNANTTYSAHHVYIYGPNLAQPTAMRNVSVLDVSSARIIDYANTHSLSTAYTGFTLYGVDPSPGVNSGVFCVYGLSQ